jgi:hypothetical protein
MPTINPAEFSIALNGDVRSVSGTQVYSTLDLHQWLQDLADNPGTTADDNVSILGSNPSELAGKRNSSRPMALTLLPSINLDDATAQRFNFGSIEQGAGQVLYTGVKTIGSIVPASPVYLVQNNAKLSAFWNTGHIQVLVKARVSGTLIDGGNLTAYSRKYGQTYSHFDGNLSAGSEQSFALGTALDTNVDTATVTPTIAASWFATAIGGTGGASPKIALAFGDTNQDMANGNGAKLYKGTITLDGSLTLAQVYQALQWACSEASSITINGGPGWRYRVLNAAYSENVAAPFGSFAGGRFFTAQGWWLTGVQAADSRNYQLVAHDGTTQSPPTSVQIQLGGLVAGDYVLAGRDNGAGGFVQDTTLAGAAAAAATSVTLSGAPADTPTGAGVIRINGNRHAYTGRAGNVVSGLAPAVPAGGYAAGLGVFIPFIDGPSAGASMSSGAFQFSTNFTVRYRVRNGSGSPIVPFESTLSVTSNGGSGTAVRTADA